MAKETRKTLPKRPLWRRVARLVVIVLSVPLLLIGGVLVFLHTASGRELVRARIVARAGEKLNGSLEIGALDFALFGEVALRDVTVRDAAGEEVAALRSLVLAPGWNELVSGQIVIDRVALEGLRLHVVQRADGGSNLKDLIKPAPPAEPAEKKARRIRVTALHIAGVGVTLDKPDGTRIAVEDFGLEASIDATPATKTARVSVPHIGCRVTIDKPQAGLSIALRDIATGLSVDLVDGAGSATLAPTKVRAVLAQRGAPERAVDLDLDGVTVAVEPGKLGATLDKLLVGPLALQSLELRGSVVEGGLSGQQLAQVIGLHVDRKRVNALIGRELLASDLDLETKLSGPPERLVLGTVVSTDGCKIALDGVLDASKPDAPLFDATLTASDLDVSHVVRSDKLPPIVVQSFRLGAKGSGRTKETAQVDVGMRIAGVHVAEYLIDALALDARYDRGRIAIDSLTIEAYRNKIVAHGTVDLATKHVGLRLTVAGDVGATLDELRRAGLKVKTALPHGALSLREDVVTVDVEGDLEGLLKADVRIEGLAIAGGHVFAALHAQLFRNVNAGPNDKKIELRALDGTVDVRELSLKRLLALRGKSLDGLTGTLSAHLAVADAPGDPKLRYRVGARVQPSDAPRLVPGLPTLVASAQGKADKQSLALDLEVVGERGEERVTLIDADVRAPLSITPEHKGLDLNRKLHVALDVPKRAIGELLAYLPARLRTDAATGQPRNIPDGSIEAHLQIDGTAAAPEGTIALDLVAAALGGRSQRLRLDGTLRSDAPRVLLTSDLTAWLDTAARETATGQVRVELGRSPLVPGDKSLAWSLDLDVPPLALASLPLPPEKLAGVSGSAGADIHLHGNREDLLGDVTVKLDDVYKNGKGPFAVSLGVGIGAAIGITLDADAGAVRVLHATGGLARTGQGLLAALRDKTPNRALADKLGNPALDLAIDLPRHALAQHAALAPALAELPGTIGGKLTVAGDMRTPTISGGVAYQDFATRSGMPGRAALVLAAGAETIAADVDLGPPGGDALSIHVDVPRAALVAYLAAKKCWAAPAGDTPCAGGKLPIHPTIGGTVALDQLVPEFALKNKQLQLGGKLSWSLDGLLLLDPEPRYRGEGSERVQLSPLAPESTLAGELAFEQGDIGLPGTKRSWHDVALRVRHDASRVRIDTLSLRESDLEKPERKLDLSGELALDSFKPSTLDLRLAAKDWLVFGSDKVGPADAPRGSLSADVRVKGDLGKAIRTLDVEVASLELLIPDRFARAHQPEETSLGDVIYVGADGVAAGKLPVTLAPPAPASVPVEPSESGLDVHVRIPNKVRVLQSPIELYAIGAIDIKRRGDSRTIEGEIQAVGGGLDLGGHTHALKTGTIRFDRDHPGGVMDLWFARREHDASLRDISKASAGQEVTIHMEGPLDNRKTTLGGAGSPGTLFDLLSIHNAGRPRYLSQPDMPATFTVEYPQHDNLLLISYLAVNAPHLLFLDKVAAWADAYDGRATASYGRIEHYEAEGDADDGSWRVRAHTEPAGAGQSSAAIDFDWLFTSTPQAAFGIGVSAGDRLGGGPGVFFEWSSED